MDNNIIKKICNLTCTKEDLNISRDDIKYDLDNPFKKYYNFELISNAFKRYLNKDWSASLLGHWCYFYLYILCGGFKEEVKENLNSIEELLKEVITWDLDGMAFFNDSVASEEDDVENLHKWLNDLKSLDVVYSSSTKWKGYTASIGPDAIKNGDQYVLLVNDESKQYIIIFTNFFENCGDKSIKYVNEKVFKEKVDNVKAKNYTLLNYSEEFYYQDIDE